MNEVERGGFGSGVSGEAQGFSQFSQGGSQSLQGVPQEVPQFPPGQVVSSGTGDIILDSGSNGKPRRGLMVALIILVVLIVLVGGGVLLWRSGVIGGGGYTERLDSFATYLIYGGDKGDDEEKLVYGLALETSQYLTHSSNDEIEKYFEELARRYEAFKNVAEKREGLEQVLGELDTALKLYEHNVNYVKTLYDMVDVYDSSGGNGIANFLNDNFSYSGDNLYWEVIYGIQKEFYEAYFEEYLVYSVDGCSPSDYNLECAAVSGSYEVGELLALSGKVDEAYGNMVSEWCTSIINDSLLDLVDELEEVR